MDILATYSSHPIRNYSLGRFVFENATLNLTTEEDVAEFEKVLDQLPMPERHRIKKVDVALAEKMVREMLAREGGATKSTDSTTGERGGNAPMVGSGDLIKDQPKPESEAQSATAPASEAPKVPGLNLANKA